MTDIQNTEYVTINKKGVFVAGKPVTHYRGYEISDLEKAKRDFAKIQHAHACIKELHIGAFDTIGAYATAGNPSGKPGLNSWCRAKFQNGDMGEWVSIYNFPSDYLCASYFVEGCTDEICLDSDLRSAVLTHKNEEYTPVKVMKFGNYVLAIKKFIRKIR